MRCAWVVFEARRALAPSFCLTGQKERATVRTPRGRESTMSEDQKKAAKPPSRFCTREEYEGLRVLIGKMCEILLDAEIMPNDARATLLAIGACVKQQELYGG